MPTHRIRTRPPRGARTTPRLVTDPEVVARFREDAAHVPGGHAAAVAMPRSEAEIAWLLAHAPRVLVVGAQSSLTGAATPMGDVVLSTAHLNRVLETGLAHVRVQAGVPLDALEAELARDELTWPPAPTFSGAFAGGVVATNAAGPASFKYGPTRDWVLGLSVVLACGEALDIVRGEVVARDGRFEIETSRGLLTVPVPSYRMPQVPKCSAGYFARPEMDLIDLFIGSEGTLGVISEITFKVRRRPAARCWVLVRAPSEDRAIECAAALREAAGQTWARSDPQGLDVATMEWLDRRSVALLREDGADRQFGVALEDTDSLLIVQLELPRATTAAELYDAVARALDSEAPASPVVGLCRLLAAAGLLERSELVAPDDVGRSRAIVALREALPAAVNRRVGRAQETADPTIEKIAGDLIVPFERLSDLLGVVREAFERRGLDYAIWGHLGDAHIHPNVIPRSGADVEAGRAALLEIGRQVVRMGGSPLAEHGVGRNPVKHALLRELYGEAGIAAMRRVKQALDPEGKLAPGVLLPLAP